jgi:hypothetical protein
MDKIGFSGNKADHDVDGFGSASWTELNAKSFVAQEVEMLVDALLARRGRLVFVGAVVKMMTDSGRPQALPVGYRFFY